MGKKRLDSCKLETLNCRLFDFVSVKANETGQQKNKRVLSENLSLINSLEWRSDIKLRPNVAKHFRLFLRKSIFFHYTLNFLHRIFSLIRMLKNCLLIAIEADMMFRQRKSYAVSKRRLFSLGEKNMSKFIKCPKN